MDFDMSETYLLSTEAVGRWRTFLRHDGILTGLRALPW
jgi:hypothetical protein